jgi:hypothetical protein
MTGVYARHGRGHGGQLEAGASRGQDPPHPQDHAAAQGHKISGVS